MKYIGQNKISYIYEAQFEGHTIHFFENKNNGEITIDADEALKACGLAESFDEFLTTDEGLDRINDFEKENPGKHFFGDVIINQDNIQLNMKTTLKNK